MKAHDEVMTGLNPRKKCKANDPQGGEDKAEDGCLVSTKEMQESADKRPIDDLTNNHLGYALTWFGMAIALAVIAFIYIRGLRKHPRT